MRTLLITLTTLISMTGMSQVSFNTGDSELDNDLTAINADAKLNLSAFNADLTATFGVSSKNIDYMVSINMEPAEMYFALELSVAVNKPIEAVIDTYENNRDKGWGYIAQQMGIKPGSPEFHALKGKSKSKKEKTAKSNGNGNSNGVQKNRVPAGKK